MRRDVFLRLNCVRVRATDGEPVDLVLGAIENRISKADIAVFLQACAE
jgi:hypothetical protein